MRQASSAAEESPDHRRRGGLDALIMAAAGLIAAAVVMGGASRDNSLTLAGVELAALPLLIIALRRLARGRGPAKLNRTAPLAFAVLALVLAIPLLQLVPLPPELWTGLPGQGPRAEALRLAGTPPPWLPLSLAPAETARMALSLVPPTAMFLGTLCLGPGQARRLFWLWLALASAGLMLGAAQLASPGGGPAYPYRVTNLGSLVGLFANRNHEAGLLLALTPMAAALALPPETRGHRAAAAPWPPALWLAGLFMAIAVVALGVIRSRAGVLLAPVAVGGALLALWRGGRGRLDWRVQLAIGAGALAATAAVATFALGPILERFASHDTGEVRFEAWPSVVQAIGRFWPAGSGLGSFDRVFQSVEPLDLVAVAYFNHAHNDYLELLLEAGLPGAAALTLFGAWLLMGLWRAWTLGSDTARAASVAILLLLALSGVDYPLRTETLMVLMAFALGLVARPGARPR